jgi:hypothetical protein
MRARTGRVMLETIRRASGYVRPLALSVVL